MAFKEELFEVSKKVISDDLILNIKTTFELVRQNLYLQNNLEFNEDTKYLFNDYEIKKGFSYYGGYFTESLLIQLQPLIEAIVQCKVYPTFSYARFCYNGAELLKHKDRMSGEYAVSMNIHKKNNIKWPIYFKKLNGETVSLELDPGDMVVYKGQDLEHWREPYIGDEVIQIFLMYVNVKGSFSHLKYDRRKNLGLPAPNKVS